MAAKAKRGFRFVVTKSVSGVIGTDNFTALEGLIHGGTSFRQYWWNYKFHQINPGFMCKMDGFLYGYSDN